LCGGQIYPIWQIVCRIFAYKDLHRTSGGRAAAAVLLPVGVAMLLYFILTLF